MADAYQEWLSDFVEGLPEGQRDTVREALKQEKAKDAFLRQADYTRKTQELKKAREDADKVLHKANKVDAYDKWYEEQAKPAVARAVEEAQRLRAQLVDAGLADATPGTATSPVVPQAVQQKLQDLERRVNLVDSGAFNTITALTQLAYKAAKENFEFDPQAVLTHAHNNQINPLTAYEQLTEPQRKEREQKALDEKLKKAREEGAREALSKVHTPGFMHERGESAATIDALFAQKEGVKSPVAAENTRVEAALAAFHEAAGA